MTAEAARPEPEHEVGRSGEPRRGWVVGVGLSAGIAILCWLLYGDGYVGSDAAWTLAWGQQITGGQEPSYTAGPTPHPLPNLVGTVLAPLGADGETVLLILGYLAVGALVYLTALVAHRLFGVVAAVLAAVLIMTRDVPVVFGPQAFLDIPFAALVMAAIAVELRGPGRPFAVLGILAVAGLIRPEAWLLSLGYWIWANRHARGLPRQVMATAALGASAGVVWAISDWVVTGDPLFSLTFTADATTNAELPTGPAAVLTDLPRQLASGSSATRAVCVVALLGIVAMWRWRGTRVLLWLLVVTTAAAAVPVVAGTPLNARYFLPTIALLCVAAGGAAGAWRDLGQRSGLRIGLAVVAVLLLATSVPQAVSNLQSRRDLLAVTDATRDALEHLVRSTPIACRPIYVASSRIRPQVAVWANASLGEVLVAGTESAPRGSFVTGSPKAFEGLVFIAGRRNVVAQPPPGARPLADERGWQILETC